MNFGNTRWGAETTFWRQNEVWCKKTGSAGFEPSREDHKSGALTTTLEGYNVRGRSAGGGQTVEGARQGKGGGRRLLVCCLVTRCFGTTGLRFVIKVPVLIPTRSCTEER